MAIESPRQSFDAVYMRERKSKQLGSAAGGGEERWKKTPDTEVYSLVLRAMTMLG